MSVCDPARPEDTCKKAKKLQVKFESHIFIKTHLVCRTPKQVKCKSADDTILPDSSFTREPQQPESSRYTRCLFDATIYQTNKLKLKLCL